MNSRITQALNKLFEKRRIVFWYDAKSELREDFESLSLPGVEKLELTNNEFGVKYRILREEPNQKFLIFRDGPQPADLDNWLLDVQLAQGEFRTDQVAIWISELELGMEFTELVQVHAEFLQSTKRKEALKKLLKSDDTPGQIRLKMLAVCVGSEPHWETIVEHLLDEITSLTDTDDSSGEKFRLIQRCKLDEIFWEQLKRTFGYQTAEPNLRDFVIQLFKDNYFRDLNNDSDSTNNGTQLTTDSLVFLKRWKDNRRFEVNFERLSEESSGVLDIEDDLAHRDFKDLLELDYFRLIDKKIISDLVKAVSSNSVSSSDVSAWIRQRRRSHWYAQFSDLYEAIEYAAQLLEKLATFSSLFTAFEVHAESRKISSWVQKYVEDWRIFDQLYRKFTYHFRKSGLSTLMGSLAEKVENLYTNNYLLKLGNGFQNILESQMVPGAESGSGSSSKAFQWDAHPIKSQRDFFKLRVRPFLKKENKVCVIISDAMRYEIGEELWSLIKKEDRYTAELDPALSMLPSYTQLGMAALLPHQELSLAEDDSSSVNVDGQNSQGTKNRIKILSKSAGARATACKTEELMAMKGDDCRAFLKEHDVIYIYHNRIDATGHKRESEERVFLAVEETLQELLRMIKKLTGANATNILVTSDHGFIYQDQSIEESDFAGSDAQGKQILFRDRRFVLGKGLECGPSVVKFSSQQLGLAGDMEALIPKSINRLRLKGSGSRFVHGGATLQEIVIPIIKINKKRQSDVSAVEVEILRGASSVITSGQLGVTFYQSSPVTDKIQPRNLRAGIFTLDGELISDSHELAFDLTSENPRDREMQLRFVLTKKADEVNGQEVLLKLEEKIPGTSHHKFYNSLRYTMRRSFTSDFDF